MSEAFDPYHRWLGIAPKDQPPHHYRLLGIDLFEDDPEVIRDATERQMAHVRKYQLGPHSAISQKILNELAAAKACLINRDKKVAYDAAIKAKLRGSGDSTEQFDQPLPLRPPSPPPPPAPLTSIAGSPPLSAVNAVAKASTAIFAGEKSSRSRNKNKSLFIGLGTAVILGGALLTIYLFLTSDSKRPSENPGSKEPIALPSAPAESTLNKTAQAQFGISDKPEQKSGDAAQAGVPLPDNRDVTGESDAASKNPGEVFPATIVTNPINDFKHKSNENEQLPESKPNAPDIGKPSEDGITSSRGQSPGKLKKPLDRTSDAHINIGKDIKFPTPGKKNPAGAIILNLPSGKTFDHQVFSVDFKYVEDDLKHKLKNQLKDNDNIGQVILLGSLKGAHAWGEQDKGKLNGELLAFYNDRIPKFCANYIDGKCDGILTKWNKNGECVYGCQYINGSRQGLCCYFKDNILRILVEMNNNNDTAVHLCSNSELIKSFASIEKAAIDEDAKMFIGEVKTVESEIKSIENDYKNQIKKEFSKIQNKLIGEANQQRRQQTLEKMNQRHTEQQQADRAFRDKMGLP
jgi:hypothetical protein